jgi:hypothetical protein
MPERTAYVVKALYRNPPYLGAEYTDEIGVMAFGPLDAIYRARTHTDRGTARQWLRAVEVLEGDGEETVLECQDPDAMLGVDAE